MLLQQLVEFLQAALGNLAHAVPLLCEPFHQRGFENVIV